MALTNPSTFGPSVKFVFKTSGSQGDMDYGEHVPEAACALPCRSCSNTNSSICLTCYSWSAQTVIFGSTCIGACPIGFFQTVSSSVDICSPCNSLCTICTGSSSNCSGCQNGTFLFNSGCFLSCPQGSYLSSNICIGCLQANCAVCNETTCTACMSGYSFFNFTCLVTCPGGHYSNSGKCVLCASNCLVCSPVDGSCSACLPPNLLFTGSCYTSCPNGVFQKLSNNLC
jgi:proprotein convertase subtilisin/kexin type 5